MLNLASTLSELLSAYESTVSIFGGVIDEHVVAGAEKAKHHAIVTHYEGLFAHLFLAEKDPMFLKNKARGIKSKLDEVDGAYDNVHEALRARVLASQKLR